MPIGTMVQKTPTARLLASKGHRTCFGPIMLMTSETVHRTQQPTRTCSQRTACCKDNVKYEENPYTNGKTSATKFASKPRNEVSVWLEVRDGIAFISRRHVRV